MASKTQSKTTAPTAKQVEQVRSMQAEGAKFGDIVAKTGLAAGQVDRIIDTDRATGRLAGCQVEGVKETAMFWLGAPVLDYLHDAPYKALAELTRDADLTYSEMKPVADAAMLARSDEAAVAEVATVAAAMEERIAQVAAGTYKRPQFGERKSAVEQVVAKVATLTEAEKDALRAALAQ